MCKNELLQLSYIDIFHPTCEVIDCAENAKYERKITVRDMLGKSFTFIAFFCEEHKDETTAWDDRLIQ